MTRVVMLGAGMIAEVHRRAALQAGAEIVGVLAGDAAQTAVAAGRWGTKAIAGLDALAGLAPDVVHICSPNALHGAHVRAAIDAGAHAICEKPLAARRGEV